MKRRVLFVLSALILLTSSVLGAETPRTAWINAKCALCHGMDGAGQTDTGKKVHTPDLRTPQVQDQTDEALGVSIAGGHARMPSFRKQADAERVRLLVAYIREIGKAAQ